MSERTRVGRSSIVATGEFEKKFIVKERDREWKGDVTEDLINRLCPEIFAEDVDVRDELLVGKRGFGKSTRGCTIAQRCAERIEEFGHTWNLIPVRSFEQVVPNFSTDPYQIVLIDDARKYRKKLEKEEVANTFNELRHEFEKIVPEGVIIVVWMIQYPYKLDVEFREQMCAIGYGSLNLSNWARRDIKETVGSEYYLKVITMLKSWTSAKYDKNNRQVLENMIVVTESWIGYAVFPQSEDRKWRPYKAITNEEGIRFIEPEEETIRVEWKHDSGDYSFQETNRFNNLSMAKYTLENWSRIVEERNISTTVQQKHIEAFLMHISGMTIVNIAAEFNVSRQCLGNSYKDGGWFSKVRHELIGHLIEHALIQEGEYYAGYKIIAGNGRVDLLSKDKKKAIEVKVRSQYDTPNAKMLSGEMLQMLDEGKTECELCLLILSKNKAIFIVYKIDKLAKATQKAGDDYFV